MKVVIIVDVYDVIISQCCYSVGMILVVVLKILYDNSGIQFDFKLVVKFIECIGIYFFGVLVEMMSGEVGVVILVDLVNCLLFKVVLLLDVNKNFMQQ